MDKNLYRFLEYEKRNDLFSRKYKSLYYWQTLRFDVSRAVLFGNSIEDFQQEKKSERNQKSKPKRWFVALTDLIRDLYKLHHLSHKDILYFPTNSLRNIEGKTVDPYFDFFEFDKQFSVFRCYCFQNYREIMNEIDKKAIGVAIPTFLEGLWYSYKKKWGFHLDDHEEEQFIKDICLDMEKEFGIRISSDEIIRKILINECINREFSAFYRRVLLKSSPRVIFVVCHYRSNLFPLYSVAKELKIPVIEIEHGLINNHESYCYMDISPVGKSLPDFLFSYGEFWNQNISLPVSMKAVAVGNPYLEARCAKYRDIVPDDYKIIFYADEITGLEVAEFALSFARKYHDKGFCVFFKIHPLEYHKRNEKYSFLTDSGVVTIVSDKEDLYQLLASAKHHVSVASTVMFESLNFNVKRYVFVMKGWEQYLQPLVDAGMAYGFTNMSEFEQALFSEEKTASYSKEMFWKNCAKSNASEELERIMNKYES